MKNSDNTLPATVYDESNGLTYDLVGDYYYPRLAVPEEPEGDIGRFGRMRKRFLKEHRKGVFAELLLTGTLHYYLVEVNNDALTMIERVTDQLAKAEGVTEELKARDQLEWIRAMNSCRARAEQIAVRELILS
ncbi:MAG: TnpV protein [Clostridia bacterium]|nr:TnpV protein [Clostridia bacterium]